jgi:hypothetical protein
MEIDMKEKQEDLKRYRENILEPVLKLHQHLEVAMNWGDDPPKEIEDLMDEIFETVTRSLGIKE